MTETENNQRQPDRLETLLAVWGAETAAKEQELPPPPREVRIRQLPWMWRCAVPAAAVLLIGLLAVWGPLRGLRRGDAQHAAKAPSKTDLAEVATLQSELDDLRTKHAEEVAGLRGELVKVRKRREAVELEAKESARRVAELTEANEDYRRDIAKVGEATRRLHRFEQEVGALQGKLAKLQIQLGEQSQQAEVATNALKQLRESRQTLLAQLGEWYFAASAPGERGVTAARIAARNNQLLRRLEVLRADGVTVDAEETVAAAETLLLRLAMLPEGEPEATGAWISAVERSGVIATIDEALLADPPAGLGRWLLEARMILSEGGHVS
ncbi:MAG: hypothetical protein GVY16_10265 [Planctomycetes bacterium]|jgi:hypothetical protein|nr:hypothetical protein [Phycisphaerae bacterium]NBB96105.1 hypothetical protein [Planctomycetota bacterium]